MEWLEPIANAISYVVTEWLEPIARGVGFIVAIFSAFKVISNYIAKNANSPNFQLWFVSGRKVVVSMGGSNELVECFCGGAVAEGGSGAVVQFVGDGVEVGLVMGVPLGR